MADQRVVVEPRHAQGLNMDPLYLLTLGFMRRGPKWVISCGNCPCTFEARLPMSDYPSIRCPDCGAYNVMPVTWSRR